MPPASFSHRSDPQRTPEGTLPVFTRCGLADGLFEHPVGGTTMETVVPHCAHWSRISALGENSSRATSDYGGQNW